MAGIESTQRKSESQERPSVILLIEPKDNSLHSGDYVDEQFLNFSNELEAKKDILLVNEMSTLPMLLTSGFKVEAVIAKIDKESDAHWAAIAKGFFMNCPLLSKGSITPAGFKKVGNADEVFEIVEKAKAAPTK